MPPVYLELKRPEFLAFRRKIKDAGNPHAEEDSSALGLAMTELGGGPLPMRYSVGSFYDLHILKGVMRANNAIAGQLYNLGLPCESLYEEFLALGLRIAQQLPGKVRDRTLATYARVREDLEGRIIDGARVRRKQECDSLWECIARASERVPDLQAMTSMLQAMREHEDPQLCAFDEKIKSISADAAVWEGYDCAARLAAIDLLKVHLYRAVHDECVTLPDEAKTPFFALTLPDAEGNIPSATFTFLDDIAEIARSLPEGCARAYLEHVAFVQREHPPGFLHDLGIEDIRCWSEDFGDAEKIAFFSYLGRARENGLRYHNASVAAYAVRHGGDAFSVLLKVAQAEGEGAILPLLSD